MVYLPHWPVPSTLGKREIDYETVFLRMQKVLQNLDNPHLKLPRIIHVAGTNGKGSTIAFLASILQAANLHTHIYTSPHLHHCNERIILANNKITDNFLYEIMEETRIAADQTPLTFFEAFTIGAFLAFSKIDADILLIEAGMGARVDATNIIEKKLASVLTPISFDHTEYLGNKIEEIAFEKSHIIRPHTPLILGPQPKNAQQIIDIIANDQQVKIIAYDREFSIIKNEDNSFDLRYFDQEFLNLPQPILDGDHQYINAATAIVTALSCPFNIKKADIIQGLVKAQWPSRIEKINNKLNKLLKNSQSEIYIDGAHNQAGAFALARFIYNQKQIDNKKNYIICGFTKNKCKKEFLENFINIADKIIAIKVDGEPNAEDSQIIYQIGKSIGLDIEQQTDLSDAIYYITNEIGGQPCRVIICGSLHLARDVKKFG